MIQPFAFARIPGIVFGSGKFDELPQIISRFGSSVLVVTGGTSYRIGDRWHRLVTSLEENSISRSHVSVRGEPSPELVDRTVDEHRNATIDVVLAWGGGSVIDAGKAVSAMLTQKGSVVEYLEGVGTGVVHSGEKIPCVAVPTTSGTGSEATKNAVLSRVGPDGFKKSLRHANFVPDAVVLDPLLMLSCPPDVTAACGMDAFTQLLESYVSTNASPMTDALALSGLESVGRCLVPASTDGANNPGIRGGMAYGALLSGITLANAGLGVVHGLASPIGGHFAIPHGVVCGTLVGAATAATIRKLREQCDSTHPALPKYARVGAMLSGTENAGVSAGCELLVDRIEKWVATLNIPRLGEYGIRETDFDSIIEGAGNKNNPIPLSPDEIRHLLRERL